MEENLYRPSKAHQTVLIMMSLSPIPIIFYGLFYKNDAWLTLILFHLSLTLLPLIYQIIFLKTRSINYFQGECKGFKDQAIIGLQLGLLICVFLSFFAGIFIINFRWLFEFLSGLENKACIDFAMECNTQLEPVLFGLYFSIINPIIEETY